MNSTFRKVLSAVLSAAMLLSLLPAGAMAADVEDTPDSAPAESAAVAEAAPAADAEDTPDASPEDDDPAPAGDPAASLAYAVINGSCGAALRWDYDAREKLLKISGTGAMSDYTDEEHTPWAAYREDIHQVLLPDGITSIGDYAFYMFTGISELIIPASVTAIGERALGESGLEDVYFGGTITAWNAADIDATYNEGADFALHTGDAGTCGAKTKADPTGAAVTWNFDVVSGTLTVSGEGAMANYTEGTAPWSDYSDSIRSVVIESGVTSVGSYAFAGYTELCAAYFYEGLERIGDYAFSGCTALEFCEVFSWGGGVLQIPDTVTAIGAGAFREICAYEIIIGAGVESIGDQAFWGADSLEVVTVNMTQADWESVTKGAYAFPACAEMYYEDRAVGTCGTNACWEIRNGTLNIYPGDGSLPAVMDDFSEELSAPWYGQDYDQVCINEGVQNIGAYAFAESNALVSVYLNDDLQSIGAYAFVNCPDLYYDYEDWDALQIPASVTTIGEGAFLNTPALYDIEFVADEDTVPALNYIGLDAFGGTCALENIYYRSTPAAWNAITGSSAIASTVNVITNCGENLTWSLDENGTLYIEGEGEMYNYTAAAPAPWYALRDEINDVCFSNDVTRVGDYAFYNFEKLTYIDLNNVTAVGAYAFDNCTALQRVWFGPLFTSVGSNAFRHTLLDDENVIQQNNGAYFAGTSAMWSAVSIGQDAFPANFSGNRGIRYIYETGGRVSDTLRWILSDGTLYLYGTGAIPDYVAAEENPACAPWAAYRSDITKINFSKAAVTSIGEFAFYGLKNMEAVEIPASVSEIDEYAFYDTGLLTVTIPHTVTTIGRHAFAETDMVAGDAYYIGTQAEWDQVKPLFGSSVFIDKNGESFGPVCLPAGKCGDTLNYAITYVGEYYGEPAYRLTITGSGEMDEYINAERIYDYDTGTYSWEEGGPPWNEYRYNITELVLPEGLTSISHYAFQDFLIETVKIPSTVTQIGSHAFDECKSLLYVVLPTSLDDIRSGAFALCGEFMPVYYMGTEAQWNAMSYHGEDIFTDRDDFPGEVTFLGDDCAPESVAANIGEQVEFYVADLGEYATYKWQYKTSSGTVWNNSSAAKANEISFAAKAAFDGRQYRCVINIGGQTYITEPATLSVHNFAITAQPKSVNAAVNETVSFTVAATGANLEYQWQLSTNGGKTWQNSTAAGADTATLTTKAIAARDGYRYRCVLTSGESTLTTEPATLTVATVAITAQPQSVYSLSGKSVSFTVAATGSNLTYQWQLSTNNGGKWQNSTATTAKTATITTTATAARDGYLYRCVITSGDKSVTSESAALRVLTVKTQPKSVTAAAGENISFTVAATGDVASYRWQLSTNGGNTWQNSTATGYNTKTITVKAAAARDGYQYRCKITDTAGNIVYSNAAKLTVQSGPVITAQPQSVNTTAGKTVKFTVTASGSNLTYQWQLSTNNGGKWQNSTATGANTATLSTTATAARDGYLYRCVITSGDKSVTSESATLRVFGIKTQPKAVTAAAGDTVTFNVTATGEGLTYQWQYKTATGTTWYNSTATTAKTAALSFTAKAAFSGREYRCVITDTNGHTVNTNGAKLTVQ